MDVALAEARHEMLDLKRAMEGQAHHLAGVEATHREEVQTMVGRLRDVLQDRPKGTVTVVGKVGPIISSEGPGPMGVLYLSHLSHLLDSPPFESVFPAPLDAGIPAKAHVGSALKGGAFQTGPPVQHG